jgi:hypothetical protein
MKKALIPNFVSIILPCVFAVIISTLLNDHTQLHTNHWHFGLAYFIVLTFILNLVYAKQAGSENFTQLMIAAIVIKLLLALVTILVYSLVFEKKVFLGFAVHFILQYILFTIFEIRYLLQLIKTQNQIHHAK